MTNVDLVTSESDQVPTELGTWTLTPEQAERLPAVLNALQADPLGRPTVVGPDLDVRVPARVLDGLETSYHDRVCGCRTWPANCTAFSVVVNGVFMLGPRVVRMPHQWSVADVLTEANRQAYGE
jgi:hypothetical protein